MSPLRHLPGTAIERRLAGMALIDASGTGAFLAVSAIFFTRSVGLSIVQVGAGLAVAAGLGLATAVPIGALADRIGPRRVLVVVSLWRAACFAAYPLVHTFAEFCAVVCLLGLVDKSAAPMEQAIVGQVVAQHDRVRTMAAMRAVRNVGLAAGALLGTLALAISTRPAYVAVVLVNAASFVGLAALAARLPLRGNAASVRRRVSLSVLRDRPYLALAGLNAVLTMHMTLLSVGIPVWISQHTHAPNVIVAPLLVLNTMLAVAFQVRASNGVDTPISAAARLRQAGGVLGLCCMLLAFTGPLPSVAAIPVLVASMVALTGGELFQSAGAWGLSYQLAREGEQAAYLSVFWLGVGAQPDPRPAACRRRPRRGPGRLARAERRVRPDRGRRSAQHALGPVTPTPSTIDDLNRQRKNQRTITMIAPSPLPEARSPAAPAAPAVQAELAPGVPGVPFFLAPRAGRTVRIRDTKATTFKISGAETNGRFQLFEHRMAPGASGAAPHFHTAMIEMFYVARGEVEFVVGEDRFRAGEGSFVYVPEHTVHGFNSVGREEAVLLIMFCPGNGREGYFEALESMTQGGRSPSREELVELMARYDQYLV
jgi:mannose-6-phosphate isomerase-like protein (cupin superfamily)/MFS family permease